MVDFEILEDIPYYGQKDESLERRYTCPAMGLFYVRGNGDIVPIAIQFHQVPSEANPIWTPNDTEMDWIYAKMLLRNADTQWHQVSLSLLDHCLIPLLNLLNNPASPVRFGSCRKRLCALVDLMTLLPLISSPGIPIAPFLTLSKGFSFLLRGTRCILHSRTVRAMVAPFTSKVYLAVFRYPILTFYAWI